MKAKAPIKILTLTLFATGVSGFTLHKGGYIFPVEIKAAYVPDPNGGAACEMKTFSKKQVGLTTFQKLNLSGALDPEYYEKEFLPVPAEDHFLGSTKSMPIRFVFQLDVRKKSFLNSQVKIRYKRK